MIGLIDLPSFGSHQSRGKLSDLVAEHLDHIHYLNDILCLNIEELNQASRAGAWALNFIFTPEGRGDQWMVWNIARGHCTDYVRQLVNYVAI